MAPSDRIMHRLQYKNVGRCRIAFRDEGNGEPLLFIHGIPTSSYLWRNVVENLKDRYRCLAPDLLGLGHTEGPADEDYTMPAQAARLTGLLDALEIDRVTVVAHDQGGAAGQILACRHTDRIERLVLTNCVCYDNWPVPVIQALMFLAWLDPLTRPLEHTPVFRWMAHSRFGYRLGVADPANMTAESIREYTEPLMATAETRTRFKRFLLAGDGRYTMEIAPLLRSFDKPARVIWGLEDKLLPLRWGRRLASDLPNAELITIPGAGHFIQEERPAELARAIADFMQETRGK